MGKIKTNGDAKVKVVPDRCKYELVIKETGSSSGEATKKAISESEILIKELKKTLKDLSKVKFRKDYVDSHENNGRTVYVAKRYLDMDLSANIRLNNKITNTIARVNANVSLDTKAYCSIEREIRKDLMKKAVERSRGMAEIIADSQGERIIGIDKVNLQEQYCENEWEEFGPPFASDLGGCDSLLDEIEMNEIEFEESVDVIWTSEERV